MHKGYVKGLDGLRAIAIMWVMFGHISSTLEWPVTTTYHKIFNVLTNTGWVGVQLFFVLSGFLITGILLKGKGAENQLRNFYMRRSLRIFPIYYLSLFFFFVLIPLIGKTPEWLIGPTDNQFWYWIYLHNWIKPFTDTGGLTPLWSLAIEEQYYLVWPLLVLKLKPKTLIQICLFMVVSALLVRIGLYYGFPDSMGGVVVGKKAAYDFTFARWDAIALGSLLALLMWEKNRWLDFLVQYSARLIGITFVLILGQIAYLHNFSSVNEGLALLNQTSAAFLFVFLVLFVFYQSDSLLVAVLEFRPLKLIGKYSYAMYLFHLPLVIVWVKFIDLDFVGLSGGMVLATVFLHYIILLSLTFFMAVISWNLVEYPLLKLKRYFP